VTVSLPTAMRTEIGQQPAALRATLDALLPRAAEAGQLAAGCRQVLFIARGTSDNAAVYGSYLLQAHAGMLATLASPSIATEYRSQLDLSGVLAVALSQSGQTEEIVETLAWAHRCGARTLAITNGAGSELAGTAELALVTRAGTEHAVPATKTFTTQLAALAVLAIGMGADLDVGQLRAVPDEIERMLATGLDDELDPIVTELAGAAGVRLGAERRSGAGGSGGSSPGEQSGGSPPLAGGASGTGVAGAVVSGRGLAYAAALELALKLKEACYLHAMGLSWADLLHGPIAVVDAQTPAILLAADSGPALPGTIELARRVVAAGARAYAIGGGPGLAAASSRAVPGLPLPEWLAPFGLIVPGQLLTEALSRRLGIDPDSPRGLSKITQTT
jgi:glutamine---fructose-6-phosphate transaminase (isomerizing)